MIFQCINPTKSPILDRSARFLFSGLIAKYLDEIFPDPYQNGGIRLKPWYTWHWLDQTSVHTILFLHSFAYLSLFFLFVHVYWCILFHCFQNLAPDCKKQKNIHTKRKLPRSWPAPFPGSQTERPLNYAKYGPVSCIFLGLPSTSPVWVYLMVWVTSLVFILKFIKSNRQLRGIFSSVTWKGGVIYSIQNVWKIEFDSKKKKGKKERKR